MNVVWRTIPFALVVAVALGLAAPLAAQDSTQVRTDTMARDTSATTPRPRAVPTPIPEVPRGPLPPGSRYTFTRDSLVWGSAISLAELLGAIPGVYIARGGWVGQTDYVVFGGRGPRGIEVYWDGMPLAGVGGDSVYFDATRIYLIALRRVDVEILPATLRIFLVSERHETLDDRSVVRVMSGDYAAAQYAGLFQKRWANGLGLGLAADFVGSSGFLGTGVPATSGRSVNAFEVWGRFDWMLTPRAGVTYQIRRQNQDRDPTAATPGRAGTRTDSYLRLFASSQPEGRGYAAEILLGSSGWGRDTAIGDQAVHHATGTLRYSGARTSLELNARLADRWAIRSGSARAGIVPVPGIVLSGDARAEWFGGGRSGYGVHGAVSLYHGPFSATGEVHLQKTLQAPALAADTAVRTLDRSVRAGFATRILSVHAGIAERDAYAPIAFPEFSVIPALAPSPRSRFFIADGKLQLLRPLTLDGWYANPIRGAQDFQPPTHGRAQLTFRSKFWRTFRSGAFDLKVQVAMESWSGGTAGLNAGVPIALKGITFYEAFISFQIVGFTAFWDLRNAYNAPEQYVPGIPYPRNAQLFGVRWEFFN